MMLQWLVIFWLLLIPCQSWGNGGTWPVPSGKVWSVVVGGASFSDDFSGTLANWTAEESTTWVISSGVLQQTQSNTSGFIRYNTPTNTISQKAQYKIVEVANNSQYGGVTLRDDSGSGWVYILEVVMNGGTSTAVEWWGYNYTTNAWSSGAYQSYATTAFVNGDTAAFEITGTGTSTSVAVKRNGAAVTTFTNDPTNAADTGKYIGIYSEAYYDGTNAYQFDDFAGGDL